MEIDSEYYPIRNPGYMKIFEFENYKFTEWRIFMERNWKLTVHITFFYIMGIFLLQVWMRNKTAYKLKSLLTFWNLGLAIFSIFGCVRTLPEMIHLLFYTPNGFHISVCSREHFNIASSFWCFVGTWSKVLELGDTVFLVLRKRPLIFLHYYHHALTMLYTWYTFKDQDATHRWFVAMNYLVHSFMYTYYCMSSIGLKAPKLLSLLITGLQISQMVIGTILGIYSIVTKASGIHCERKDYNLRLNLLMYISYLILFVNFFHKAYLSPPSSKTKKVKSG